MSLAVGVVAGFGLSLGLGCAVRDWLWLRRVERASGDREALARLLGQAAVR